MRRCLAAIVLLSCLSGCYSGLPAEKKLRQCFDVKPDGDHLLIERVEMDVFDSGHHGIHASVDSAHCDGVQIDLSFPAGSSFDSRRRDLFRARYEGRLTFDPGDYHGSDFVRADVVQFDGDLVCEIIEPNEWYEEPRPSNLAYLMANDIGVKCVAPEPRG